MRAVVQRVSSAKVSVEGKVLSEIGAGLLILLGIHGSDNMETIKWFCNKIANLRIFQDEKGKMNLSVLDNKGEILLISNFTVYGDSTKGFRPNFMEAAPPEQAKVLFGKTLEYFRTNYPINIGTGEFGAMMDIELVNSGPVTVIIEK